MLTAPPGHAIDTMLARLFPQKRRVVGVRDPLAAVVLDVRAERDAQAVGGVAVGGELAV
jgi:hypothetical protein